MEKRLAVRLPALTEIALLAHACTTSGGSGDMRTGVLRIAQWPSATLQPPMRAAELGR